MLSYLTRGPRLPTQNSVASGDSECEARRGPPFCTPAASTSRISQAVETKREAELEARRFWRTEFRVWACPDRTAMDRLAFTGLRPSRFPGTVLIHRARIVLIHRARTVLSSTRCGRPGAALRFPGGGIRLWASSSPECSDSSLTFRKGCCLRRWLRGFFEFRRGAWLAKPGSLTRR
jgi:hypothetical protein